METLTMGRKERDRLTIMAGVTEKELTVVAAASLMGGCDRQSKRIWRRYQAESDAGLVHRLRGQSSTRCKPPELSAGICPLGGGTLSRLPPDADGRATGEGWLQRPPRMA